MPVDTPVDTLVRQLSRVGLQPDPRLVDQIVARGDEARAALLELATNVEALHEELPAALGPLHALRLLGELPDVTIIAPLLNVLPVEVYADEDVPARLFAAEMLQIVGRVGAPAVEVLLATADDTNQGETQRAAAMQALSYVATYAPEVRAAVLDAARARLADEAQPAIIRTGAAVVLSELGDSASYQPVMAAYRAGTINQDTAPAGAARQFLLGGGRKDLSCVNHPLWERYEQHGPTPRGDEDV